MSKPETPSSEHLAKARVDATRQQLEDTLDAIEDKLNVPKQIGLVSKRVEQAYRTDPKPFLIGGAAVAALAVGGIIWAALAGDD